MVIPDRLQLKKPVDRWEDGKQPEHAQIAPDLYCYVLATDGEARKIQERAD